MKLVAIVGVSGSGKTTVAEGLIRSLRMRGLGVASAKSIACGRSGVRRRESPGVSPHREEAFSIDTPGSNSYRHRMAGSQLVVTRAAGETAVLFQEELSLSRLLPFFSGFDCVILEGDYDAPVPRIVTGWEEADVRERINGMAFAVSGRAAAGKSAVAGLPAFDPTDPAAVERLADLFLEKSFPPLPDLSSDCCGLCGRDCRSLGEAILRGEAVREDCRLTETEVSLTLGGRPLPLAPFVQRILKNAVLGVVSELDGYREGAQIALRLPGREDAP